MPGSAFLAFACLNYAVPTKPAETLIRVTDYQSRELFKLVCGPYGARSPAGSGAVGCLCKTFSAGFGTMREPLFRRAHVSGRVLMQTREHLFAAMASRSNSVTFRCATDVALGSYHKEVNERSAPPVPFFRVDSRWISNWHTERKSSRTQQSEI